MYQLNRPIEPEKSTYKLKNLIGEGQSALVYKAIREDARGHSRQTVALKILKDETQIPRLRREFEAITKVESTNCVKVLAWENLPEGPALVLEWIEGISLLRFGRERRLSKEQIAEIVRQTQEGLRALDKNGISHGDLSPNNILVDRFGTVRLIDFALMAAGPIDGSFETCGTPAYVAPEVWSGKKPDINSDLFALGLIALDLQNGFRETPFTRSESRERAFSIIGNSVDSSVDRSVENSDDFGFFHPLLTKREFLQIEENPEARSQLAEGVTSLLVAVSAIETEIIASEAEKPTGKITKAFFMSVFTMIFASAVSVNADAPVAKFDSRFSSIGVFSQKWMQIELNGKNAGYAPLRLGNLLPGSHRLIWRTKNKKGELRFTLSPGESLKFYETQLMRGGQGIKR